MTAYTDLRGAIASVLETIPSIGMIHDYERFVVDPQTYLDLFKTTIGGVQQIRAWEILRERADVVMDTVFQETRRRHIFVLQGTLGLKDGTETYATLQDLADTVMAAFDAQTTLSVAGVIVGTVGPCSLRPVSTVQFGSTLCNRVELELPIDVMLPTGTA